MAFSGVGARLATRGQTVMDVPPMIRRDGDRIDADGFHRVDRLEHKLDLGPAVDAQQDIAAGTHEWQRRIGFATCHGPHDVDARDDRAEVVRRPADKGEGAARRETDNAPAAIEDLLLGETAEAYPVLDTLFVPGQFDMGQGGRRAMNERATSKSVKTCYTQFTS